MAVKLADAVVYLNSDDSGLKSGMARAKTSVSSWGSVLTGMFAGIGVGITQSLGGALSSVTNTIQESIGLASNLAETQSKVNAIFGESAETLLSWSKSSNTTLGQTQQTALDAASTFAMFGKTAGLAGEDLVGFSTDFVTLATDLASFNNTSPEQAIEALGAALRGESEPIRAYQVLLDDATLKARALSMGIWDGEGALTQQQKVLAAYNEIMAQTTLQQGDFAKTSDGMAGQLKILNSTWDDLKTTIGAAFLPLLEPMLQKLNELAAAYLPAVADYITKTLIPSLFSLANWFGDWWRNYGSPFVEAFSRMWSSLRIREQTDIILGQLNRISGWFSGIGEGGGGDSIGIWAARSVGFITAIGAQFQALLGVVEAVGESLQALTSGDWRSAIAWTAMADVYWRQLGANAFATQMQATTQAALQQTRSPVTINMTVNGNADNWSVTDALLTALAQAGY